MNLQRKTELKTEGEVKVTQGDGVMVEEGGLNNAVSVYPLYSFL